MFEACTAASPMSFVGCCSGIVGDGGGEDVDEDDEGEEDEDTEEDDDSDVEEATDSSPEPLMEATSSLSDSIL